MSTYQLGFIGTGNMGGALAQAAAKSGAGMLLSNRTADKAVRLAAELGCAAGTNLEVAEGCKYIFLGVKPQMLQALLAELNLPVALGKGVVLISPDDTVTEDELTALEEALKPAGLLMRMPEDKLDAGSAVSGCGPAFVYLFLDALANGGVSCGLPYPQALALAAQTMIGAAEMALASGKHPGKLQSEVCSPGGTTIAGVRALEQRGARAAAMDAVIAAYERTCELTAH